MISNLIKTTLNIFTRQKGLLPDAATVFLIKCVGALLAIGSNILLSRLLGTQKIGIYYLALAVVNIAMMVGLVGMGNALIRFSAQSFASSDWLSLAGLYKKAICIATSTATPLTLIIFVLAPLAATHIFHKPDLSAPLRWMSIAILPMNLLTIHVSLLKGAQKFAGATLIESVGVNVVIISLLFAFHKQMTSTIACICFSVSTILASYVGLLVWRKRFPILKNIKGDFDHRIFIQTSLPLFGVALMNLVMSMSDTIMIGLWHNSYLVGIYGVALRIASISSMFLVVANTILAPKFSVMFHNEDHIGLSRLAREATILMTFLAAIFLTMFVVFPAFFLGLFGDEFIFGKKILVILAVGQFVVLSTGPVAALLMMTGHEKFHRNTTALSAAMNIILNIVLIPSHGAEGAAFSTAFALALKNILAVMHVRKKMDISLLFLKS